MSGDDYMEIVRGIGRSHRRYLRLMEELTPPFKVKGLTQADIKIIRALRELDNFVSVSRLAQEGGFTPSRASHALKTLEEDGFVSWQRDDRDARYRLYRLTESGERAATAIELNATHRVETKALYWGPRKIKAVARVLGRLVQLLEQRY